MAVVNNGLEEFPVSILTFIGLVFLPVPDLTNGIHLLRTLP
jgi:hypothetical protein